MSLDDEYPLLPEQIRREIDKKPWSHDDLLTEEQFRVELYRRLNGSFPQYWGVAEMKMYRSVNAAIFLTRPTMEDAFIVEDPAIQLLEEALPHLPDELAERVRQHLEK